MMSRGSRKTLDRGDVRHARKRGRATDIPRQPPPMPGSPASHEARCEHRGQVRDTGARGRFGCFDLVPAHRLNRSAALTFFEEFDLEQLAVPGGDIRLRRGGSGPPLLLLHGNPQTHAMWHAVAPALAERFAVVCPDLRGYGGSFEHFERTDMAFGLGYCHWLWLAQPHPFPETLIDAAPEAWFRAHTAREPRHPERRSCSRTDRCSVSGRHRHRSPQSCRAGGGG